MPNLCKAILSGCAALTLAWPAGAAPDPLLRFNHLYTVVDAATAEAIASSELLRQIASFEVRRTGSGDRTWSGRYVQGRATYLELFGPGDLEPGQVTPIGSTGVAFSVERVGKLAELRKQLEAAGQKTELTPLTRKFDTRDLPWFDVLNVVDPAQKRDAVPAPEPFVGAWSMEYKADYFDAAKKEPAEGPDDTITRERYNSDDYAQKLIRDVSGFTLAATRETYVKEIAPYLGAGAFRVREQRSGVTAADDEVTITIAFVDDRRQTGLREVRFALNRDARRQEIVMGASRLALGPGRTARWTFPPPPEAPRTQP